MVTVHTRPVGSRRSARLSPHYKGFPRTASSIQPWSMASAIDHGTRHIDLHGGYGSRSMLVTVADWRYNRQSSTQLSWLNTLMQDARAVLIR